MAILSTTMSVADAAGAADVKVEIFETAFAEVKQTTKV